MELTDVAIRFALAVLAGAVLGVNRDLHRKPAGLRTHALVSLGSALAVVLVLVVPGEIPDALSRVIQGVLTGIGFIGAGVIMHHDTQQRVEGLTTAASIWVAAGMGIACGLGRWDLGALALIFTLMLLVFGGPIERFIKRLLKPRAEDES